MNQEVRSAEPKVLVPGATTLQHSAAAGNGSPNTPDEPDFDDTVKLASEVCGTRMAFLFLLDAERPCIRAHIGFAPADMPRLVSIGVHAARNHDLLVVSDATKDARTACHPLVTGETHVRFYAGMPLVSSAGVGVQTSFGALCILDTEPRDLSPLQALTLKTLARQVSLQLELRRSVREERESNRRNAAILTSAIDYAIVSMDLEARITSWNTGAEQVLGWTAAEMIGRRVHDFFIEEDVADAVPEKEMDAALLHGRGNDERWHQRKDGSRFWALGEMMPLRSEDGTPEGFVKILRDRTEQRRSAETQRLDAEFMRSVLASSADCIKVLDLDAKLTFMSEGGMQVMEVGDFNAIAGCPWPDFWRGLGNDDARAAVAAARAGGVGHFQGVADTFLGRPRWWDVQVTPMLNAQGGPERLLSVSRDITDQKLAEQRLAASEEQWRSLFEGMHEGFFIGEMVRDDAGLPRDFRLLELNPSFERQAGLDRRTAVGRTICELVPSIQPLLIDTCAQVVATGRSATLEVSIPLLGRSFEARVRADVGQRFTVLFLDITERKLDEVRRGGMIELGDRLRTTGDTAQMAYAAAEVLGRTLGATRAGYVALDASKDTSPLEAGWSSPGQASASEPFRVSDHGALIDDLERGEIVVVHDVISDPRTAQNAATLLAQGVRVLVSVPLIEHSVLVAFFYIHHDEPKLWTVEDLDFARHVADRTRASIARVRAEEQQVIVNLEISHRMKNMLAMVQSIAAQTMRNAPDTKTANAVLSGRLIALGQAHDLLLGGARGVTSLHSVIDAALTPHQDVVERFEVEGPELMLGSKAALYLSLSLHELATNAAKYGALSTASGRVTIHWETLVDRQTTDFCLRWSEVEGPRVVEPSRKGFGSRLLSRVLAITLNGKVSVDYHASGVVCTIVAPLKNLQLQ